VSERPTRLSPADIQALDEEIYPHPLNINAVRRARPLGDHTGLRQLGVQLVRLTPGHDSTEYHRHHHSDEFVYVLEGRGTARLGAATVTIGPGDFLGFPAGGEPHCLSNPYEVDLLYLVGGNRVAMDTVDYPDSGKRLSISGDERRYGELSEAGPDTADD
jgi:uncharacterized cupin superfamily protein